MLGVDTMKAHPLILICSLAVATQCALGDSITLTGTVRDFVNPGIPGEPGYLAHPDFEGAIGGLQTGAVQNTLGADGKPVWNTLKPGFTSEEAFNQWYNNTPGVNAWAPLDITLTDIGGGIYSYSSSAFFPIDNQLLGNQGRANNFHFTFELHSQFTYVTGQNFSFNGDDDLWLFINDQLVVDLGGVHSEVSGSVNLDTLGLTEGATYGFDLFFAERHTSASNFKVETSIVLEPTPVPEGGSILLLCGVSGMLLAFLRRK